MLSLTFGLAAALAWACHDLLVRKLAQGGGILPMLLVVLVGGSVGLALPALVAGGWGAMTGAAFGWAALAAGAYVAGAGGLYQALGRAPVRLVAPILGSYPMLSLGIAAFGGKAVGAIEWGAVAFIVAGIGWVALGSREDASGTIRGRPAVALVWAAIGAVGFAATFALGQEAARSGAVFPAMVVTRLTATALILGLCLATGPLAPAPGTARILVAMGCLDALALGLVTAAAGLAHPEYAAVASALFGVLSIILARRFLNEHVTPRQWGGIAAVFGGIGVLSLQG